PDALFRGPYSSADGAGLRGPPLGSKFNNPMSRVARKNGRMAGERRRAYRQYGRAFRRTSRPVFPQPEGTRAFWLLAASLVAHGLKPTSLLAPGQKPKFPAS